MIPPHMWHLRVRSAPYFQNCISGFQALFSCSDSQNRFCKIPCTLQYGGANLPFSPLPSTFLAAIALLTVREFSQEQQWLTFKGGACELCLVTQDDVSRCVCLRASASVSSFCAEVTSLARCSFICDVIVCTLTASPTRLLVSLSAICLSHCSTALDSETGIVIKGDKLWL